MTFILTESYCRTSQAKGEGNSGRDSKSLKFEKRNFHIFKRVDPRKDHTVKFDLGHKESLDGVYDDDQVNIFPVFQRNKYV